MEFPPCLAVSGQIVGVFLRDINEPTGATGYTQPDISPPSCTLKNRSLKAGPWLERGYDLSGSHWVRATGGFHRAFGEPIAIVGIGCVTAVSGWVPVETLATVFDKALIPLTVIWGLQGLSGDNVEARWSRGLAGLAKAVGLFAVVAILVFTALPRGGQELVSVFIVLLVGAAGAQLLATRPAEFMTSTDGSKRPVARAEPWRWVVEWTVDSLVVVLAMAGIWRGCAHSWDRREVEILGLAWIHRWVWWLVGG